jgi:serine/threonine protein kinase
VVSTRRLHVVGLRPRAKPETDALEGAAASDHETAVALAESGPILAQDADAARAAATEDGPDAATPFDMPFQPGEVLVGKYIVEGLVGVGGLAFVVAARHIGFDRSVALKFLRPELARLPEALRRFTAEAQNNFRLDSQHIVRVLDVDTLPQGLPFMVMELLQGHDLRSEIARDILPVERAVQLTLQIAEALATAHTNGVIHCDIKPENVFLVEVPHGGMQAKVLDFGISRALVGVHNPRALVSDSGAIGSPPYMSPEQIRALPELDARTDVWSLGCVLFELLTRCVPFGRQTRTESCVAVLEHEPPALHGLRPEVSPELEAVVMRCLRKDAAERFQSVAELAEALAPFATGDTHGHVQRISGMFGVHQASRDSGPLDLLAEKRPSIPPPSSFEAQLATQLVDGLYFGEHGKTPPPRRLGWSAAIAAAICAGSIGFAAPHLFPEWFASKRAGVNAALSVVAPRPTAASVAPAGSDSPVRAQPAAALPAEPTAAQIVPSAALPAPVVQPIEGPRPSEEIARISSKRERRRAARLEQRAQRLAQGSQSVAPAPSGSTRPPSLLGEEPDVGF